MVLSNSRKWDICNGSDGKESHRGHRDHRGKLKGIVLAEAQRPLRLGCIFLSDPCASA
jgi:hypothetical protein